MSVQNSEIKGEDDKLAKTMVCSLSSMLKWNKCKEKIFHFSPLDDRFNHALGTFFFLVFVLNVQVASEMDFGPLTIFSSYFVRIYLFCLSM